MIPSVINLLKVWEGKMGDRKSGSVYTEFRSKAVTINRKAVTLTVENPARKAEETYTLFNFNFIYI
jgi:hypothetical protein